jgi:hypothetical protein
MRLDRMGSAFPTRLSFMRTILRWLAQERSEVTRPVWEIDDDGYGRAVYSVPLGGHVYSLAAFSNPLEPERRTDRVIAEAWDTAYVLYDGVPDAAELDRLQANAPRQEAGRFLPSDLVLSRANKSVRLFEHVVERLAAGRQPDEEMIGDIGYLMRTTAVYGNGKFGIADRPRFCDRPGMNGPYRGEMLSVWLTRGFTHDLVEHVARCRSPESFVPLERRLKRHLGIGNSTGLGMAPFLVSHPDLLNNWTLARETALARVRAIESASEETISRLQVLMARVQRHLEQWNVADVRQMERIVQLRKDFREVAATVDKDWMTRPQPWDELVRLSKKWSMECQELIVALVLEPHGELVDGLTDCMASSRAPVLDPSMRTSELRGLIDEHFTWVRSIDFTTRAATQQFWYSSEEKLEPRLGDRYAEPGAELEMPLDIARRVQALDGALAGLEEDTPVAVFLMRHPEHRYAARRVQTLAKYPYGEIHDNLIGEDLLAIDMLRYKLAFFGASKFDPKSDRWTRIEMYQGAPLFDEILKADADDWWLPVLETSS